MQVVSVSSMKGGCGKTTTTANLGAALAGMGQRVLLVDFDPQRHLSMAYGADQAPVERVEDLLLGASPERVRGAVVSCAPSLGLLTTSFGLAGIASPLAREDGYQFFLRDRVLEPLSDDFDLALVDTPPSSALWPTLALLCADATLIPAQPADFDVNGAADLRDYIDSEIREFNRHLRLLGVVLTMVQRRWLVRSESRDTLEGEGLEVFDAEIPLAVDVKSSPRAHRPLVLTDPTHRVSRAYRRLAREVAERLAGVPA